MRNIQPLPPKYQPHLLAVDPVTTDEALVISELRYLLHVVV